MDYIAQPNPAIPLSGDAFYGATTSAELLRLQGLYGSHEKTHELSMTTAADQNQIGLSILCAGDYFAVPDHRECLG